MITITGLDVLEDTVISQTKESQPLNNLEVRRRTYTNKITLPNTPKNQQAFRGGFSSLKVAVFENGVPIATETNAVEIGKDNETRSIELRTAEFDLFDKLGELTIGELFSDLNHEVDFYKLSYNGASDFQYSIMDFGTGFRNNTVELEDCYPQIRWAIIKERLLSQKGIRINFYIGSEEQRICYLPGVGTNYDRVGSSLNTYLTGLNNLEWNEHGPLKVGPGDWTIKSSDSYYKNSKNISIPYVIEFYSGEIFKGSTWGEDFTLAVQEGEEISVRSKPRITSSSQNFPPFTADIDIDAIPNNKWRNFPQMFPIKIADVIRDLLQRYNAVLTTNNDAYEIVKLQPTFANVEDWSRKYAGNSSANYIIGGWAKNNYFKEISGGRSGVINISDTLNYSGTQDVVTSPFHAPRNGTSFMAGKRIAKFPIIVYDDAGKKIPNTEINVGISYSKTENISFTIVDNGAIKGVVSKGIQIKNPSEGDAYYDRVNIEYETLKREMKYPSYYTFDAFLAPQDLQGILPRKIWIEQENSYFLVFKISGYVMGKKTKIEALKILK